jgi:capsular polysaccharide transport system permease protein
MNTLLKLLFGAIFIFSAIYIISIETERYESVSLALLKDLSKSQEMEIGSLLLGQSSGTMQDSKILELYIRSNEMYDFLDNEYNLSTYYVSEELDFLNRLYEDTSIPFYLASKENLVKRYNEDLQVLYDQPSGTLSLSFAHKDKHKAKKILESIISRSDEIVNMIAKKNAEVALDFTKKQIKENKALFITSIKNLIAYQNQHHTIDPNLDVERKSLILANLESDLVKNQVEYDSKAKYTNLNSIEMKLLKEMERNIKKSIEDIKRQLAGRSKTSELLNSNVFEFELLKSEMEFNKEVYRQSLINQEQLKIEVSQNAKRLAIVSRPTLADGYTYPNKPWDIFTVMIVLFFLYSVVIVVITIIKDHQD